MGETVEFNVFCVDCGAVSHPRPGTNLYNKAKARWKSGRIDALAISGEECGCRTKEHEPEAPYRVFGFTDDCQDFNVPFYSLVEALRMYLKLARGRGCTVFFEGGSEKLQQRLRDIV